MMSIPKINPEIIDKPELAVVDCWMTLVFVWVLAMEFWYPFSEPRVIWLDDDCLNDFDIQTINEYTTWNIAPAPMAKKITDARGE